ncbi:unnamed protein product [Rotaria socialis]|uniref:F-box domain-containing protein n=1 Tax=Rotaria socialis TaxID=392032 RepID=A0A818SRK3_9BILA|nr:unnamed protein product [Rotaria socialis]CAF4491517.1 unnamed protein product [Rotaria socialis]
MTLESLANELLLSIFEFFSTGQLLQSFYGLKYRFDVLIFDHISVRGFDLRLVSKHDLDTVCQQYLPSIVNRITTLHLSDDENSQQIVRFVAQDFTLHQFAHLRTLNLYDLISVTMMNKILLDCCHLSHLTHIKLTNCYFSCSQTDVANIINTIWSLPKLIYCYIDIDTSDGIEFSVPNIISSSLEYLFIPNMICHLSDFAQLIQSTARLRYLSACFTYDSDSKMYPSIISLITHFDTWFVAAEQNNIINIFKHMPNLCSLTVRTINDISVDGRQWEKIIRDHLIKLKRFRLKLTRKLVNDRNWKQSFDELINSFRSQFWLQEHRWFVQCDWDPDIAAIYLYTLPYAFDHFTAYFPLIFESTCPHNNCYCSYDRVNQLKYMHFLSDDLDQCQNISFSNVRDLTIYLPINNHLWTIVPNFHQLTSLSVAWYNYDEKFPSQLQLLLDRASRLNSLSIETWRSSPTQMAPFEITHNLIRKLDLYSYHYHYNNADCTVLSCSSLGIQCEILRISVEIRTCVLDLVKKMPNLHQLIVHCRDDNYREQSMTTTDELVEWLQQQLPSKYGIARNICLANEIKINLRIC